MLSYLAIRVLCFSAFVVFVLAAASVKSYVKYRAPKRRELHNILPEQVLSDWHELASGYSNQLLSLGFVRTGFIASTPPSRINVELLTHARVPVSASAIVVAVGDQRRAYVELKTRFDDGHSVSTVNSRSPGMFIYPENIELHRSKADWVRQLLNEHVASVRAASSGRTPLPAPQSETAESVMAGEERVLAHQVTRGLFRETGDGKTLRYTARGALRCTFRVWRTFRFLRPHAQHAAPPAAASSARAA